MADPIKEQLVAHVKTTLQGITTGAGYQQTVVRVFDPGEAQAAVNVDEYPSLLIVDGGEVSQRHLRGAYENRLTLQVRAFLRQTDEVMRGVELARLAHDVQKVLKVDETRGGKAKKTFLRAALPSRNEDVSSWGVELVTLEVLYRVERANPYATTEI